MYVVRILRLMGLSSTSRKLVPGCSESISDAESLPFVVVVSGVERRTRSGREISWKELETMDSGVPSRTGMPAVSGVPMEVVGACGPSSFSGVWAADGAMGLRVAWYVVHRLNVNARTFASFLGPTLRVLSVTKE